MGRRGRMSDLSLVNVMCLDIIINAINRGELQITNKDLSYQILADFWQHDIMYLKLSNNMRTLNEVKSNLILRYGLSNDAGKSEIIQILSYAGDKQIDMKLLSVAKQSLKSMGNVVGIINNEDKSQFIKLKGQKAIIVNEKWANYIKENMAEIKVAISDSISTLLKGQEIVIPKVMKINGRSHNQSVKKTNHEVDLNILEKLEKKMRFYQELDKNEYSCLEAAFEWLNMSGKKYDEYKVLYTAYVEEYGVKSTTFKLPFVSTMILLYTGVYRYNEEDSNGFWPEFFDGKGSYNYSVDVKPVMDALEYVAGEYGIDTSSRYYLDKRNLAKVFSHIYIPRISVIKIYNSIYTYYFKDHRQNNTFILNEFLDTNTYKLDKAGEFFLTADKSIDDPFLKTIEMFNTCLFDNNQLSKVKNLPARFIDTFREWLDKEKERLDQQKEDYYIDSPKIKFDRLNEKMRIYLPYQKSKIYSDERCGWDIRIDSRSWEFIYGRIVKQREGAYLVLDEEKDLPYFKKIEVKYLFNNEVIKEWKFENKDDCLVFDKSGNYYKTNRIKRDGCIIGIRDWIIEETSYIVESYVDRKWEGYIFQYLDMEEYYGSQIILTSKNENIYLEIDDQPSVVRKNFKIAFEDVGTRSGIKDMMIIYEEIGRFYFNAPHINVQNFKIGLNSLLEEDLIYNLDDNMMQEGSHSVKLDFPNLNKGIYYLTIRYKNVIIYRERFALVDKNNMNDEFNMSYQLHTDLQRKISISKNNCYEIVPMDARSLITEDSNYYHVIPDNTVKAKFGLRAWGQTIPVEKVILPLMWNIIGLEDILYTKNNNRFKEITKEAFDSRNIRLNIENYDYRYDVLTYIVSIKDHNSGEMITEMKRLEYGGQFNISFNEFKDRLIKYFNISVRLTVRTDRDKILYEQDVLSVVRQIRMYNFQVINKKNNLSLTWEEKHKNKSRVLKLHNYTKPWEEPIELEVEDGLTAIELISTKLERGQYFATLDFKKEHSIFSNINTEKQFLEKRELSNFFSIKNGKDETKAETLISQILKKYAIEEIGAVEEMLSNRDLKVLESKKAFYLLLQMKYFTEIEDRKQLGLLLEHSYIIITNMIRQSGIEALVNNLFDINNLLLSQDFGYLLNMILSQKKQFIISNETIDKIAKEDTISALCCIENGRGSLTNNLRTSCLESFDHSVLNLAGNAEEILRIVSNEINMINNFWNWVNQHKNSYMLNKKYTLSKMFRLYQIEKNIITMRISGNTVDNVVDSISCQSVLVGVNISKNWSPEFDISQARFNLFMDLFKEDMDKSYRQLLYAAFTSVGIRTGVSDVNHFKVVNTLYFSEQWDLFQRYRAYFKLILI